MMDEFSPDALASAANYLASIGWKRGEPCAQGSAGAAVAAVGSGRPDDQAAAVAKWAGAWGVTQANGKPL